MEGENFRRSIRSTAGNRYQALLATEDTEKDDFYSTQYGGFVDVKSDDDFRSGKTWLAIKMPHDCGLSF